MQRLGRKERIINPDPYRPINAEEDWKGMAIHLLRRVSELEMVMRRSRHPVADGDSGRGESIMAILYTVH